MLRPNRLAVVDRVKKNGISYYDDTFFAELPRLYCQFEDQLKSRFPEQSWDLPNFFRIGSWIKGRPGRQPFVTADILKEALRLQSSAALDLSRRNPRPLRHRLPLSQMLLPVSAELAALASRSPDRSPTGRTPKPTGAPSPASTPAWPPTSNPWTGTAAAPRRGRARLDSSAALVADLQVLAAPPSPPTAPACWPRGRLRRLIRAVQVFLPPGPSITAEFGRYPERSVAELLARPAACLPSKPIPP